MIARQSECAPEWMVTLMCASEYVGGGGGGGGDFDVC